MGEGKYGNDRILNVILIICWEQQVSRPGEEERSGAEQNRVEQSRAE